jgi:hypothetical protein
MRGTHTAAAKPRKNGSTSNTLCPKGESEEGGKRKYLSAGCFRANLRLRETDLQRRALFAYNKELVFAHRTENVGALRLDFYKKKKEQK